MTDAWLVDTRSQMGDNVENADGSKRPWIVPLLSEGVTEADIETVFVELNPGVTNHILKVMDKISKLSIEKSKKFT